MMIAAPLIGFREGDGHLPYRSGLPILNEKSTLGSILKALFGYNGNPSLLEVIAYGVYFIVSGVASSRQGQGMVPAAETSS